MPLLNATWPWSWSTLPVWASGQGATDFSEADVRLLTRYPVMWTQGQRLGPDGWITDNRTGYTNYENATESDARKIHAAHGDEPVFSYYGFMGSCNGYSNWWWPQFNSSASSELWLRGDDGRVCYSDTDHPPLPAPGSPKRGPLYDLCKPAMMRYYRETILSSVMGSAHVGGSFFDEVDHVELMHQSSYWFGCRLSSESQQRIATCWRSAMANLTEWMAEHGKWAIMSTQAYVHQHPEWHEAQLAMLRRTGSFYYLEALCPDFAPSPKGHWMCGAFTDRVSCCLDQIATIERFTGSTPPVPTMIRAQVAGGEGEQAGGGYFDFLLGTFLVVASERSYVAFGQGWSGPQTSFPWFEAYDRPLGRPLGPKRVLSTAYGVFTRSFEHLDVAVNVSNWSATLTPR